MAYAFITACYGMYIERYDGVKLLEDGVMRFAAPGGNSITLINNRAYTAQVNALRQYRDNSNPTLSSIFVQECTLDGNFLHTHLPHIGDYMDIYNKTTGKAVFMRVQTIAYSSGIQEVSVTFYFAGSSYTYSDYRVWGVSGQYNYFDRFCVALDPDTFLGVMACVYGYTSNGIDGYAQLDGVWTSTASLKLPTQSAISIIFGIGEAPPTPSGDDPYADGGYSTTGGGGGDFDDTSDTISLPSTPALNLSLNHFISAYVPNITELNALADWIWGNYDKSDLTKVLGKIFTEPMEAILSLHMLPFTPSSSTAIGVNIGNFSTGLTMSPLTSQFTDIDCGSLDFSEFWGNYLDYNPYTKIVLCLPFVGQVDLDADEVMGKTVKVLYRVDNLTGAFVCFVYIDSDKVLGQYSGECMLQVPVTAGSYAAMNAAIASVAVTSAASFGGAVGAAIGGGYGGMIGVEKGLQMSGDAVGATLASGAGNVNGMKLQVSHSGALTGTAGFLGCMKPYVIIHRPRQSVPENYQQMAGYPSNVTKVLGDCSGFTSVRTMIYDGLPFTDGEILALDQILKGGVFI